jgi:imidazolonepropionase-like amidohydrolase
LAVNGSIAMEKAADVMAVDTDRLNDLLELN